MPVIIFYEKPGCISNGKQKEILKMAGYSLVERNILKEAWKPEELRKYFGDLPIEQWFNKNAPALAKEQLFVDNLSELDALTLMINDPILIRRPLMRLGDTHKVGFDAEILEELVELKHQYKYQDLELCSRSVH